MDIVFLTQASLVQLSRSVTAAVLLPTSSANVFESLLPVSCDIRVGQLLQSGVVIAIVTAASYLDQPEGYERRIDNLIAAFREAKLDKETLANFYLLGGECNYLFQCDETCHLRHIPRTAWQNGKHWRWHFDLCWNTGRVL